MATKKIELPSIDDVCAPLRVSDKVPQFEMETYEPSKGDFGTFSMADQVKKGRWTVLFFYPADFTFV